MIYPLCARLRLAGIVFKQFCKISLPFRELGVDLIYFLEPLI